MPHKTLWPHLVMFYYCLFKQTVCFMFYGRKISPRENKQEPENLKGKKVLFVHLKQFLKCHKTFCLTKMPSMT